MFYYLYLIIDLYSRDIVGWEVWEEQSAELASELIRRTCLAQHRLTHTPLVLHSDNGTPMNGTPIQKHHNYNHSWFEVILEPDDINATK